MENKEKKLKKRFEHRWRNIKEKTKEIERLSLPNKEKLWKKLLKKYRNDFKCSYCNEKLKIKDSNYPYYKSFSIDHKKSIDLGGSNKLENLTICCHRCNIIKGTMTAETFKKLLKTNLPLRKDKKLLDKIFEEMWNGRIKNKLNQEENRS